VGREHQGNVLYSDRSGVILNGGDNMLKLVVAAIGAIWAVVALLALTLRGKDRSPSDSSDSHHPDAGDPTP